MNQLKIRHGTGNSSKLMEVQSVLQGEAAIKNEFSCDPDESGKRR